MRDKMFFGPKTLGGWMVALALGLAATVSLTAPLYAQFSGPALTVTPDTNAPQKPTTDNAILMPGAVDPVLNPGDLIVVKVFGTNDFATPVRVSVDGTIKLPLIAPVALAGLSVSRAQSVIADRYSAAGIYINPQVSIQVTESAGQFASVTGELHATVPISGERRLFDVLAAAGSMPPTASHTITILRNGQPDPIIVDLGTDPAKSAKADIQILPGDKIIISRVGIVYILGAFKTQGAIPLQQNSPLTLMQATALSGGVGFEGRYKDLRIVRSVGTSRTVVKLDIKKVLDGKDPDPVLQADDVVFLPSNDMKAAIKSGGINTVTGILSLLIISLER